MKMIFVTLQSRYMSSKRLSIIIKHRLIIFSPKSVHDFPFFNSAYVSQMVHMQWKCMESVLFLKKLIVNKTFKKILAKKLDINPDQLMIFLQYSKVGVKRHQSILTFRFCSIVIIASQKCTIFFARHIL